MKKSQNNPLIAVVGLYHLGSVVSICLASLNFSILGIDNEQEIAEGLNKGELPLFEVGLSDLLKKSKKSINFSSNFSSLQNYKTVFFTQDTETDGTGSVKKLETLITRSIPFLSDGVTIVLMSQVPIGFHRKLELRIKKIRPNLNYNLFHWVDTIIMTKAIERFIKPERIIIGCSDTQKNYSLDLINLLRKFKCPVLKMSYESAELTKAAINLYLANSVIFGNTLSDFAEKTGANIYEIIPALKLDKRIGKYSYIYPTLGISGGHLERDLLMLSKLAKIKKIDSGSAGFILKQNKIRLKWLEKKLLDLKKSNPEFKTISLWGLSYKKDSTSTENSPSLKLMENLSGKFKFKAYDPAAIISKKFKDLIICKDKYEALKNSDCLLLMTAWDEFRNIDLTKLDKNKKLKKIIDCTGSFYLLRDKLANYKYECIGLG